jgi:hypothetical protein
VTQPFGRRRGFVYVASPRPPEDDWIAVVAESFVALVETGQGEHCVDALSELAGRDDTTLEQVVSSIPLGEGGVASFAVAHVDEDGADGWQATAVVRGRAVVDAYSIGGARRFSSSGVQPWLIATFRDVVALELGGPARRFDAVSRRTRTALQIGLGTAHAGSVLWSAEASERLGGESSDIEAGFARPAAALAEDTVRRLPGTVLGEREEPSSARPAPVSPGRPRPPVGPARPAPPPPPPPASAQDGPEPMRPPGFDEETVLRHWFHSGPGNAAVQFDPEPVPVDEPVAPSEPVVRLAPVVPTEPVVPAAPVVPTEPVAPSEPVVPEKLVVPEGAAEPVVPEGAAEPVAPAQVLVGIRGQDPVSLDAPAVFGRRPAETRRSEAPSMLITVVSPNREVSASHVRIERAGAVVVVTDLRSRNGTVVTAEGGRPRRLRPGEAVVVPGEAAVEIGDGTIIDITPVWWTS